MEPTATELSPWLMLPFGLLLGCIALLPAALPQWWARHYPKVALLLGLITLGYYLFCLRAFGQVAHTGREYLSFIALVGSLFVVSGGIHISVKGEATPAVNTLFLLAGALLANLLGTTGASMLLIRPWIRLNRYRVTGHHIVFFIFLVSNVGGCLTPVGDPPLFLGYLRGIPFWWVTRQCWPMWAVAVSCLLAMFYVLDWRNYRQAPRDLRSQLTQHDQWRFEGLWNLAFLGIILGAVFIDHPPFLREGLMLTAALASFLTTHKEVHRANHFNFHPIQEVAILFAGIFATMMPALEWLQTHAHQLHRPTPGLFYWGCGILSSLLDNAPTYLSFLSATLGLFGNPELVGQVHSLVQTPGADIAALGGQQSEPIRQLLVALQQHYPSALAAGTLSSEQIAVASLLGNAPLARYVVAISIGAVFFGACTYIGNGPNFMVKAIAEHSKVRTPGFLRYLFCYTLPLLTPILLLIWLLFFR